MPGIGLGLAVLSQLKEFGWEILDVGQKKVELLRLSAYILAQNLEMSADTVGYYVSSFYRSVRHHGIPAFLDPASRSTVFIEKLNKPRPHCHMDWWGLGPSLLRF